MKEKIISIQEEIKNYSGSGDESVEAFRLKGQYFDCGTPKEYVNLLKETIL